MTRTTQINDAGRASESRATIKSGIHRERKLCHVAGARQARASRRRQGDRGALPAGAIELLQLFVHDAAKRRAGERRVDLLRRRRAGGWRGRPRDRPPRRPVGSETAPVYAFVSHRKSDIDFQIQTSLQKNRSSA
jgi:hypothetical protein